MSAKVLNSKHVVDTQALYDMIDELRVDDNKSWLQVGREMGVHWGVFSRMRDGHTLTADVFVTILAWAEVTDPSPYILTREEMRIREKEFDQVCIIGSPSDKMGR